MCDSLSSRNCLFQANATTMMGRLKSGEDRKIIIMVSHLTSNNE